MSQTISTPTESGPSVRFDADRLVRSPLRGLIGEVILDRFVVNAFERLSSWTMAFRADDRATGTEVEVHSIHPQWTHTASTRSVARDHIIRWAGSLAGPNIEEWGQHSTRSGEKHFYFVTTLDPGKTLATAVANEGFLVTQQRQQFRGELQLLFEALERLGDTTVYGWVDEHRIWLSHHAGFRLRDVPSPFASKPCVDARRKAAELTRFALGDLDADIDVELAPDVCAHIALDVEVAESIDIAGSIDVAASIDLGVQPGRSKAPAAFAPNTATRSRVRWVCSALYRLAATATLVGTVWFLMPVGFPGGQMTYTIVSGRSMEPTFHTLDLVVARHSKTYEVGDVVTFRPPDQKFKRFKIVHRIEKSLPDGTYQIKGDNKDREDPWAVPQSDIFGKKLLLVPKGGWPLLWLRTPIGLASAFGLLVAWWAWPQRDIDDGEDEDEDGSTRSDTGVGENETA